MNAAGADSAALPFRAAVSSRASSGHGRGFTLLEVLVVLVITGLFATILMQGLSLILSARMNLAGKIVDLERVVLQRNLFLEPLRGLVPDYPEKPNVFKGTDRLVHGLTIHPIFNRPGTPVGFDLYFEYDVNTDQTTLQYQESGRRAVSLGAWTGNTGAFSFRDRVGDWKVSWPPSSSGAVPPTQTPWLVRIQMGSGFPKSLVASVGGQHDRILRLQDSMMGQDQKAE